MGFDTETIRSTVNENRSFFKKLKKCFWLYSIYVFVVFTAFILIDEPVIGLVATIPPFGFLYALLITEFE